MTETQTMKRTEIRAIVRKRRGAQAEIARRANVNRVSVSQWFKGRFKSANIEREATAVARELIAQDQQ